MGLVDAFNSLLSLKQRDATLYVMESGDSYTIKIAPTDFTRTGAGPASMTLAGRQFILSKGNLQAAGFTGRPKRGDQITDAEMGNMAIEDVEEMYELGAAIIAYRVTVQ